MLMNSAGVNVAVIVTAVEVEVKTASAHFESADSDSSELLNTPYLSNNADIGGSAGNMRPDGTRPA
jgi:hypothetical protein